MPPWDTMGVQNPAPEILSVNVFSFVGNTVYAPTIQFSHCSRKVATDNMHINGCGCVSVKLYLQTQVGGGLGPWTRICLLR